jgi:hypothetical protein
MMPAVAADPRENASAVEAIHRRLQCSLVYERRAYDVAASVFFVLTESGPFQSSDCILCSQAQFMWIHGSELALR